MNHRQESPSELSSSRSSSHDRRQFLSAAAAAGVTLRLAPRARAAGANDKIVAAIMGTHNRGSYLAKLWTKLPNVEIAYICDCDDDGMAKGLAAVKAGGQKAAPQGVKDFRRALDDSAVDVFICAAPDHWHATATTLACAAGKHVYCEKPCSYTGREGELMIEAARKHKRIVQVGMQRRSSPKYQEVVEKIAGGVIGKPMYARSWYNQARPTIGRTAPDAKPPAGLDFDMWQGPAPERPFRDNLVHYKWHFFWHWGTSELGNNGVHTIDICRWALGVDFPKRVTVTGGKYRFPDDDQETPDTACAVFDYGDKSIVWEGLSWSESPTGGIGIEIRGENGSVTLSDEKYTILDAKRKVVEEGKGHRGDEEHQADFIDAIRNDRLPNADIAVAHASTALCHLGNISYKTGRSLNVDPKTGAILNDAEAVGQWTREYRDGWAPTV